MDSVDNPYVPGFGVVPPALTGREPQFADLEAALERVSRGRYEQPRLLSGDRGMGKTAVLAELAAHRTEEGGWTVAVEASRTGNALVLLLRELRQLLFAHDRDRRVGEYARQALAVLASLTLVHGELKVQVDTDPVRGTGDTGDLGTDLGDLLVAAGRTARAADTSLLLTVDEVQVAADDQLGPLFVALQRLARHEPEPGIHLPVLLVAAGLPGSRAVLRQASSTYAERVREHELGLLEDGAATDALLLPSEQQGVSWQSQATADAVAAAGGYPFLLQLVGYETWNHAAAAGHTSVTADDVATGTSRARRQMAHLYDSRLGEVPDTEMAYLQAVAGLSADDRRSSVIAERLGGTSQQWAWARQRLIERGLLRTAGHGQVSFALPGLAEHLRNR